MRWATVLLLASLPVFIPSRAEADWRLHFTGAAAKAVRGYQKDEFGFGAYGAAAVEYAIIPELGVQFELAGTWLTKGDPSPLGYPTGWGSATSFFLGGRARPFASSYDGSSVASAAGLWASAAGGMALTGSLVRGGLDAGIGWDLLFERGHLGVGPMLGYLHIFQGDDSPRPADASVLIFGVHLELSPVRSKNASRDRDGDGIENSLDACPDSPEDFDQFQDEDGCPDPDNDRDGIADNVDKCPLVAEDIDSHEDEDGCPDPDNDADGIVDSEDLCPNEKETLNGYADQDGCPDAEQIRVVGDKIVLDEQILFETNLSAIRSESNKLLERLVKLLQDHPEYAQVSIEGHTDERGSEELNQRLSEERAQAVKSYLVARGISAERLTAHGLGSSQPRIERSDALAYTLNRRVEFHVTRVTTPSPRTEQFKAPPAAPPAAPAEEVKP